MRRAFRGLLWVIKGLLLAVCISSIFLWRHSYRYYDTVIWHRYRATPIEAREYKVLTHSSDGRFVVLWFWKVLGPGSYRASHRDQVDRAYAGPTWRWNFSDPFTDPGRWDHPYYKRLGPLRWNKDRERDPGVTGNSYTLGIAYWALTPLLGIWPAASLSMLIGRRSRLRRRRRMGQCESCGYDLRATPQTGGVLLDRCPECGKLADAPAGDSSTSTRQP